MDGVLKDSNIILGDDLNIPILARQVWGQNVRLDPLTPLSNNVFREAGLVDIQPTTFVLTWNNGRLRDVEIAKRLD